MRLVIEEADFQRLSTATQNELLQALLGRAPAGAAVLPTSPVKKPRYRLREPVDLSPELTAKLMHGLAENHRRRLRLFAERGGRVSMRELMALTGDTDVRALSHFEGAVTRRLRRILGDKDKVAYLIGWDYDSTQWNDDTTEIVDGTFYVTEPTLRCLREHFELD